MYSEKMKEAHAKAKLLKLVKKKVKRGVRAHKGSATQAEWQAYQDRRHYLRQQAYKEYERRKEVRALRQAQGTGLLKRIWNWLKRIVRRKDAK